MSVIVELDYRPKLSAIRDQGPRPTCLAFATTAVHEYARQSKEPLSPEYLHYFASEKGTLVGAAVSDVAWALNKEGQTSDLHYFASEKGTLVGAAVSDVAWALNKEGQTSEVVCPYWPGGVPNGWAPPMGLDVHRRDSETHHVSIAQLYALLRGDFVAVLGISLPEPFFAPLEPWVLT